MGPVDLLGRRREDPIGQLDLRGVDGPLALVAEGGGPTGAVQEAVGVVEVAERAVDGPDAVGPTGHQHPGEAVVPLVARIVRVQAADVGGAGPAARGIVGHAEVHCLQAGAGRGDGLDVRHPQRGLDEGLDADLPGEARGLLDLADHGIDHVDVGRHADLGDQDGVEVLAGLLHHVDDVPVHVVGVDTVDPHRDGLAQAPPVDVAEPLDDVASGLNLVAGGDGILQVEEHVVDVAGRGLLEEGRVGPGDGELAALEALAGGGVTGVAHGCSGGEVAAIGRRDASVHRYGPNATLRPGTPLR